MTKQASLVAHLFLSSSEPHPPSDIAETSITIEDVVFVVDTGRVKENRRDEVNETPTLVECWVSRASAKQRRGRAGRVRPGTAYHLYSSHTHDTEMLEYQLPEMLRVGIEDLVLQILVLDLGEPTSFLRKALDPPTNLALSNSLKLLEQLGAVDCKWQSERISKRTPDENQDLDVSSELTALGFHLATLPVDPRVGKCLIYASLFGCVDPLLTLAASMSSRSPFNSPFDQREQADEARKNFSVDGSDHLTILNVFDQWSQFRQTNGNRAVSEFEKQNFLSRLTLHQMDDLRRQYHSLLVDIGFLPKSFRLKDKNHTANAHSQNLGLVRAVLCAGLYPGVIVAPRDVVSMQSKTKVGENAFRSHTKGDVYLHPSTGAFDLTRLNSRYCCYHEMVRTSKTYVRDCTPISPFALLLFGGTLQVYQTHGICSVDGWLKFRISAKPATLIKYLRGKMEQFLFNKIVDPEKDVMESTEGRALIESINLLFEAESKRSVHPDRSGGEIVRPWVRHEYEERNSTARGRRNSGARGRGRGGHGRSNAAARHLAVSTPHLSLLLVVLTITSLLSDFGHGYVLDVHQRQGPFMAERSILTRRTPTLLRTSDEDVNEIETPSPSSLSSSAVSSPMHHSAIRTRNITLAMQFYSMLGFETAAKFRAGPARAAWLEQNGNEQWLSAPSTRIELIEVPSYALNEPEGMKRRAIDLMARQDLLGHNHLAFDVTESATAMNATLAGWMDRLNQKSIQMFGKTLRVALEPQQQIIGGSVYELAFIYDADGCLIEFLHEGKRLPQNVSSGWELGEWEGWSGSATE